MDLGGHDLMLDALCRHLGHQSEEKLVALQEPVKRMAAEEGLRGALPRPHQGAASRPSSRRLRNVVEMLRRHSYEVCYLRAALQQALSQSPEVFPPTEALAERQQRLDDFFSSWRESPRKSQGSEKLWPMESTTVGSSWKARGSRSRCTATVTSNWEWSQHLPSTLEEEFTRRRSSGLLLPPLQRETLTLTQADTVDSAAATVATDRFNYVALFPGLAKRKPMPTRRLFLTEDVSSPKGAWKVQELLVERQHPEVESVVAPSELSEAQRLLEGTPKRRTSVTVRPMLTSQSQPLLLEAQRFAPSKPSPKAANLGGLARQLVSMNYEDFQERVFQDRAPDAGDPAPQRLFDRRFRRDMALPVTSSRFARTQGAALSASGDAHHGLPALVQKGSSWEPEREHPVHSPKSAAYFRTCLSQFVLPELLPFFTGHSQKLEAENRQLTDRDVLAMGGLQSPPSAIHFGNNVLLTDKSMVPFLASVLKQPAGSLLSLRLHYCRLGYDSCVKLASLLDSQVAKNLRALNLSGIPFGMAVQVHLASSIREHDKLRDLRLADTQLSADCMELIAENHQLELLDLGWNSMDAQCLAAIGLSLSRNVSLHTLSLPRCSSAGSSIAILLEFLGGIQGLQELDISSNQIDHRAALVLEDVLTHHQHLKRMNVSENPLGLHGLRSLLRLLCDESTALRRFECHGCFLGEEQSSKSDPSFRASSPGGLYQLDLAVVYHRSILRMLAKAAERLRLNLSDAMTFVGAPMVPEKSPDGRWVVPSKGTVKLRFHEEKSLGSGLSEKWDFATLLQSEFQQRRRALPTRKQMQLLLQVCRMRCQIQEQAVLLDALSQDFRFSAAQLRQLCWEPEIAGEVMWRLLHCTEAPYLLLLAAPSFRVHVNALQRTCQLRAFNAQCPNGHYRLDLANPADVEVGQRLVTLDRWEAILRVQLKRRDTGRRSGSCMYEECHQGEELPRGLAEWNWPEHGMLDLEYASGKRPTGEEPIMAMEPFRQLCQALLCSQLSEEAKVAALRPVAHHFLFSAFQLRTLCWQTASTEARARLFELFLLRVSDIQNIKLILDTLELAQRHPFRLNQCLTFPFIQPEGYDFELNLKYSDHRLATLAVFKLCEAEGWSILEEPSFSDESQEADFWRSSREASLDNLPMQGIFRGKVLDYLQSNRNLKCRRQLLESLGFWSATSITEDQVCWCNCPEAPQEIYRLAQSLMLRYPDVVKAYPLIVKSVPGGVDTAGAMTSEEFDDAMCALKVKRLDSQGVAEAFSYLTTETITQAAWKKLEPFIKKIQLNAQDFIAFMRSIAGDVMEDWWQLMAPDSMQVGLVQWNDACRSLGFHGDAALTYQLLEEEGKTINWTDFQRIKQFWCE